MYYIYKNDIADKPYRVDGPFESEEIVEYECDGYNEFNDKGHYVVEEEETA